MSHPEQQEFVSWVRERHPQYFRDKDVLEVGSLDINGSVRPFFQRCNYLGIDLGPGPGVDKVSHVLELDVVPWEYHVVISCEAMEHDSRWFDSIVRMQELLRDGGLLLVTCAGPKREPHGYGMQSPECSPYTNDHYKNLGRGDIESLLHFPAVWRTNDMDTQFYMIKGLDQ